jgi:Zn-dependent M28 family amino/carboxypeptidase
MKSIRILSLVVVYLLAARLGAQVTPASPATRVAPSTPTAPLGLKRIDAREIDAHLRFLSSDLLEGRAPATRGGRLATEYISGQLESFGVEPGVNGSWFQEVPIDVVRSNPSTISVAASGKATANLKFTDDVVVWAGGAATASAANGELVFVGYGVKAPEYRWDDFKGADLKGKILLVLVNDPPAPPSEPNLFGGKAMTYYGRWTYKYEEAERQGAAGMLIVHTTDAAGYPWQVVVTSNSTDHRILPRDPKLPPPIAVRGWITNDAATSLLAQAGLDLANLRKQAESRDFKPVPTGITIDAHFTNNVARMQSENVVGVVRGSDPRLRNEYVVYSAHWDHLGIGPPDARGDSIYNGASDNASGVADILAIAHSAALSPRPRRSQIFLFVTAEESGLLGSEYFGGHPTVPARNIIADLNVDGGNILGRVRDLNVLGATKSSLGPSLAAAIRPYGMRITPEAHPERGLFYRSDHFSFAKFGIPAVSIGRGTDFVGRPADWGKQQDEDYTAHRYHQPSDEYHPGFDLTGAVQLSEIIQRFGVSLANAATVPTWNSDAEFKALRDSQRR